MTASERKASFLLSGDQATLPSAWTASATPALMRLGGVLLSRSARRSPCCRWRRRLCDDIFDPGDFLAVGRDGGLFETVRGGERVDDVLRRRAEALGFCDSFETRFGGLLGTAGLLGRGFLREGTVRERKNVSSEDTAMRVAAVEDRSCLLPHESCDCVREVP